MTDRQPDMERSPRSKADLRLAAGLMGLVILMLGLSYAAVPLYRIFCQVTGYGGTTQRAQTPSQTVLDRSITVRFDANVSSGLGWSFRAVQHQIRLKIGENQLAFYKAANVTGQPLTGTATFNVTPEAAGVYFNKVQCFCFEEQTLAAGQEVDMPVSFYIDPAIVNDPDASRIEEITLSYTFFKVAKPAEAAPAQRVDSVPMRSFEHANRSG